MSRVWRNVNTMYQNDTNLCFTELSSGSGTNIFLGDEDTNSYQGSVIEYMLPYVFYIVVSSLCLAPRQESK